jgi:hypothetical protein
MLKSNLSLLVGVVEILKGLVYYLYLYSPTIAYITVGVVTGFGLFLYFESKGHLGPSYDPEWCCCLSLTFLSFLAGVFWPVSLLVLLLWKAGELLKKLYERSRQSLSVYWRQQEKQRSVCEV